MKTITPRKIRLLRRPEMLITSGISKNTLYTQINEGLMPPPIAISNRAVGFVEYEVQTVLAAMVSGKDKETIQALVKKLVEQREELFKGVSL